MEFLFLRTSRSSVEICRKIEENFSIIESRFYTGVELVSELSRFLSSHTLSCFLLAITCLLNDKNAFLHHHRRRRRRRMITMICISFSYSFAYTLTHSASIIIVQENIKRVKRKSNGL
jgi:hypothetical protein